LQLSGSDTAENVVRKSTGLELSQPEFWVGAIRSLSTVLRQFKASVKESQVVLN